MLDATDKIVFLVRFDLKLSIMNVVTSTLYLWECYELDDIEVW